MMVCIPRNKTWSALSRGQQIRGVALSALQLALLASGGGRPAPLARSARHQRSPTQAHHSRSDAKATRSTVPSRLARDPALPFPHQNIGAKIVGVRLSAESTAKEHAHAPIRIAVG